MTLNSQAILKTTQLSKKLTVVCAISGGVDSSVSVHLLKKKGFKVIGVHMTNWDVLEETGSNCTQSNDLFYAQQAAKRLDVEFHHVDFIKDYWNFVFTQLIKDYKEGYTPNPDILCNRHVKFGSLFQYALSKMNMDYFATGHYAKKLQHGQQSQFPFEIDNGADLMIPFDKEKDQTLFLSSIEQIPLRKTIFPLSDLKKPQVKKIAKSIGLEDIATKRESYGICFIGKRNFSKFLSQYLDTIPGIFVNIDTGKIMGHHDGTLFYTVGQRSHLNYDRNIYYIVKKVSKDSNDYYVAKGCHHKSLYSDIIITQPPHWIGSIPQINEKGILSPPTIPKFENENVDSKCIHVRYQHSLKPIKSTHIKVNSDGSLKVKLSIPLRAIAPGQYCVFYYKEICLGSAKIVDVA